MDKQKVQELIEELEAEINNGGFHQFFFNSSGDNTFEIIEALKLIGAIHTVQIVKKAVSQFPGSIVPKERYSRQDILDQISPDTDTFEEDDEKFYEYVDDLENLVSKYVANT